MLNVSSNSAIHQQLSIPSKEIVAKEKLQLDNDLAKDKQIALIEELNASEKLKSFDQSKEMEAFNRFNSSFKEFQIRKNALDDYLEAKNNTLYQQAYKQQEDQIRMLDEVV